MPCVAQTNYFYLIGGKKSERFIIPGSDNHHETAF